MKGLRAPGYSFEVEADALCARCKRVIRGGGNGVTAKQAKDHARVDLMKDYELHVESCPREAPPAYELLRAYVHGAKP